MLRTHFKAPYNDEVLSETLCDYETFLAKAVGASEIETDSSRWNAAVWDTPLPKAFMSKLVEEYRSMGVHKI
jgi:hypothetical protein